MRQLAHELGPNGITVNAVAPGFLRTSPDYERQWQSYGPEGQKAMIERVAMRRLGEPQDIAHAVMFLASPYASWITGQVLPVTGSPDFRDQTTVIPTGASRSEAEWRTCFVDASTKQVPRLRRPAAAPLGMTGNSKEETNAPCTPDHRS